MLGKLMRKWRFIGSLFSLGWSVGDKFKLSGGFLFVSLLWKMHPHDISLPLSIRTAHGKISIFLTGYSDFMVLREVFIEEEYDLKFEPLELSCIIDAGSNVGFTALYFAAKYPNAKILCFEPDPVTFKKLQRNTQYIPNIVCFNAGLGSKDTTMPFYVHPHSSISSSFVKRKGNDKEIQVLIETLDSILEREHISSVSLLKFDVEGFELELLNGLSDKNKIEHYVGELHFDLISERQGWFEEYFADFKLRFVQISPNRSLLEACKLNATPSASAPIKPLSHSVNLV